MSTEPLNQPLFSLLDRCSITFLFFEAWFLAATFSPLKAVCVLSHSLILIGQLLYPWTHSFAMLFCFILLLLLVLLNPPMLCRGALGLVLMVLLSWMPDTLGAGQRVNPLSYPSIYLCDLPDVVWFHLSTISLIPSHLMNFLTSPSTPRCLSFLLI